MVLGQFWCKWWHETTLPRGKLMVSPKGDLFGLRFNFLGILVTIKKLIAPKSKRTCAWIKLRKRVLLAIVHEVFGSWLVSA